MTVLSVRLDSELEKKLSYLMRQKKIQDRSAYIRLLLERSLGEDLLEHAIYNYQQGNVSLWKAAEIAGVSLRRMMKETSDRGIETYNEKTFEADSVFLRKLHDSSL